MITAFHTYCRRKMAVQRRETINNNIQFECKSFLRRKENFCSYIYLIEPLKRKEEYLLSEIHTLILRGDYTIASQSKQI